MSRYQMAWYNADHVRTDVDQSLWWFRSNMSVIVTNTVVTMVTVAKTSKLPVLKKMNNFNNCLKFTRSIEHFRTFNVRHS